MQWDINWVGIVSLAGLPRTSPGNAISRTETCVADLQTGVRVTSPAPLYGVEERFGSRGNSKAPATRPGKKFWIFLNGQRTFVHVPQPGSHLLAGALQLGIVRDTKISVSPTANVSIGRKTHETTQNTKEPLPPPSLFLVSLSLSLSLSLSVSLSLSLSLCLSVFSSL